MEKTCSWPQNLIITSIVVLFVVQIHAEEVYEGDLILPKDEYLHMKENGLTRGFLSGNPWPNGVIPYRFDPNIASSTKAKREIINGMNEWMSKTCIKFVPWKQADKSYITYVKDNNNRCASYGVGHYHGYNYKVVLAERCWYQGMIVHELGHVIGFKHEHNRPDRDKYVTIKWQNIKDGRDGDFTKYNYADPLSYVTPYNYESIMHYGPGFASRNGEDTIIAKKSGATMGDWKYLTQMDVKQLQIRYNCPGKFEFHKIICENDAGKIECFGGRKIKMTYADYGRQNMLKCSFFPWTLCSSNQLTKMKKLCEGKSRCDFEASNSFFGDPCKAATKYLEVKYKCTP